MSPPTFRIGRTARRDIDNYARWLQEQAGADMAIRFAQAALESMSKLAASPGVGSPVTLIDLDARELRKGRVVGFPKMLIFYRSTANGVDVVRVLHAAQDWIGMLD